jgi:teichuronic acid biosynthesis glycosyltransferase TuaH
VGAVTAPTEPSPGPSVIVCSLEPWGTVRRRIRILVDELVALEPRMRVLYVAPAFDVVHEIRRGVLRPRPGRQLEQVHPQVHVLRPRKWLPRSLGPASDRLLGRQVARAADQVGLHEPLLWVNDAAYARFSVASGWPIIYDVTDDWLLAPLAPRQRDRLRADDALLVARSDAVVVCSPDLARSRGRTRAVDVIPNGADVERFGRSYPRPADLPEGPVALYVGTLHEERIDLGLLGDLARARPDLQIVLVGPDNLPAHQSARLAASPSVHLLGARPYDQVPAYLQHADVVIVPHQVNPFTESLDPIKAYECLAAGRPTVATPVAGFRHLGPPIVVAERSAFVAAVLAALGGAGPPGAAVPADQHRTPIPSWHERALAMASVMDRARHGGDR